MKKSFKKIFALSSFQIVALGFAGLILLGAFLLMLPISSAASAKTPFLDALFTATTSVCVTGLVVQNTATYWSGFGHTVILLLIQIGGLGVVTVAASFALISGRKIGLFQRSTMQESVAAPKLGGIVALTKFILKAVFLIEFIGALFLAPVFIKDFGIGKGIWFSIFHSISAFCNAGIDLLAIQQPFASLTAYASNPLLNITIMFLIIIAGLGFITWDDIRTNGIRLKRYCMQSKVILVTTLTLIILPAIYFFIVEFSDLTLVNRILASLFQSVTTRTAGFNTMDLTRISEPGQLLMIFLMLIGGSPGSTAGGMKTTTFAVLIACAVAVFKKRDSAQFYGRRIAQDVINTATTLCVLYVGLCILGAMILSLAEGLPMITCLYETASAVATVGLTLGITPSLSSLSKCVLIVLMYIGRVGGLTLIYAALKPKRQMGKLPLDRITVG